MKKKKEEEEEDNKLATCVAKNLQVTSNVWKIQDKYSEESKLYRFASILFDKSKLLEIGLWLK